MGFRCFEMFFPNFGESLGTYQRFLRETPVFWVLPRPTKSSSLLTDWRRKTDVYWCISSRLWKTLQSLSVDKPLGSTYTFPGENDLLFSSAPYQHSPRPTNWTSPYTRLRRQQLQRASSAFQFFWDRARMKSASSPWKSWEIIDEVLGAVFFFLFVFVCWWIVCFPMKSVSAFITVKSTWLLSFMSNSSCPSFPTEFATKFDVSILQALHMRHSSLGCWRLLTSGRFGSKRATRAPQTVWPFCPFTHCFCGYIPHFGAIVITTGAWERRLSALWQVATCSLCAKFWRTSMESEQKLVEKAWICFSCAQEES